MFYWGFVGDPTQKVLNPFNFKVFSRSFALAYHCRCLRLPLYAGAQAKATAVARAPLHQNLNSGSFRVNGLKVICSNSWHDTVKHQECCILSTLILTEAGLYSVDSFTGKVVSSVSGSTASQRIFQCRSCKMLQTKFVFSSSFGAKRSWQETKSWWKGSACRFQDHT